MNPANLKWRYLLEDVQSSTSSGALRTKVKMCLSSLSKFPLVSRIPYNLIISALL